MLCHPDKKDQGKILCFKQLDFSLKSKCHRHPVKLMLIKYNYQK